MKVCPVCGTSYEGKETFCPQDGGRLEERVESTGKLIGDVLAETTKLERLEFADAMGERYAGRFTDTKRAVYVTVFNQNFSPSRDARRLVETARAQVGNPLPPQLSAILRVNFKNTPSFVVETSPAGPSVRALLQERQRLDWQTAVRVACNVARVVEWLAGHGVAHHGLHPGSVFVTDIKTGAVQLCEWYSEDTQWVENPMQVLSQDDPPFVGYVAYMAPELAEKSSAGDLRSAVYALGVLLYEMIIGKPPFVDARGVEVLRQHIHEQPIRVSIARGGGEVHQDLDHILEMMLAKDPDARFQAPAAVIAALSNLLHAAPPEVAPAIERATKQIDDDIFQTIEMSSVDRDSVPGLFSPKKENIVETARKQSTSQNAVAKAASLNRGSEEGKAPAVDNVPDDGVKKTLMMSNIGAALEAEAERQKTKDDVDPQPQATLMMGKSPFGDSPDAGLEDKSSFAEILKPTKIKGHSATKDVSQAKTKDLQLTPEQDATLKMSAKDAAQVREKDAKRRSTILDSKPTDAVDLSSSDDDAPEISDAPTEADPALQAAGKARSDAAKAAELDATEDPTLVDANAAALIAAASAREADRSSDSAERGVIKPAGRSETGEFERQEWFSGHHDDAWHDSLDDHHHERHEALNRVTKIALIVGLIVAFVVALVYFEFLASGDEDEPVKEEVVEVEPKPEPSEPAKLDLSKHTEAFDAAIGGDRLVAPPGGSALSALEGLQRDAPKAPEFEERRQKFVDVTTAAAKKADADGDLLQALALAGHAIKFAPQDEKLKAMMSDLQTRFAGTQADAGAAADAAGTAEVETPEVETPEVETPEPKEKPKVVKKDPEPKKAVSKKDPAAARVLARKAKNAYHRNDIKKAQTLYEEALTHQAANHQIHAGLGQVYFDQAKYSKAVKHQGKAVKLKPGRVDYRISLGQSYYRLGRYAQAIKVWEAVLARDPNNKNAQQYIKLAKRKL